MKIIEEKHEIIKCDECGLEYVSGTCERCNNCNNRLR